MNSNLFIPVSKHDFEALERIKNAEIDKIQEVLPQIFDWIEDINWPIAPELVKILVRFDEMIIPYVIDLIHKPDGLRECSVYYHMIPLLSKRQLCLLREELERVANKPSHFEKNEEYDKIALQYLQSIF